MKKIVICEKFEVRKSVWEMGETISNQKILIEKALKKLIVVWENWCEIQKLGNEKTKLLLMKKF